MAMKSQHKASIRNLNHKGLLRLWTQIKNRRTPGWPDGKAFEYLILRAFEIEGAEVRYAFPVRDSNIGINEELDGVVYLKDLTAIIECKDVGSPKNFEPIAKLRSQLARRPSCTVGMVFSRSGYTDPAIKLAYFLSPQTILMWEGEEIELALRREKMIAAAKLKNRTAVERGMPFFNVARPKGVL